ncbi:MAG: FAD-dependent monooxygenase [Caldilineaceae bacterium]|nr:FAD-dependent monooxygenase [Caldilineaceae bacterium]
MMRNQYDLIIVGGGIGGCSLALTIAGEGVRVLVLETENRFRDRVRGEWLAPWGVSEAKRLGIYDTLLAAGAHELRYIVGGAGELRDLTETTTCHEPSLAFYHPAIQEAMVREAVAAGIDVQRGVKAQICPEHGSPQVRVSTGDNVNIYTAKMIVGADGRNALSRQAAGFAVQREPDHLEVAGVLFANLSAPEEMMQTWRASWEDADTGVFALLFPQGGKRVRAYISSPIASQFGLSGKSAISTFIELFQKAGAPAAYFAGAKPIGPLACYRGTHAWVAHPYKHGVALIGDAAATTDPTHGQGISLTLRDVRVLRDQLVSHNNWDEAGHAYATEHDHYHDIVHTYESWVKRLWYTIGPEATARRQKVLAAWEDDPSRTLDIVMSGPNEPLSEETRQRFFAEI